MQNSGNKKKTVDGDFAHLGTSFDWEFHDIVEFQQAAKFYLIWHNICFKHGHDDQDTSTGEYQRNLRTG